MALGHPAGQLEPCTPGAPGARLGEEQSSEVSSTSSAESQRGERGREQVPLRHHQMGGKAPPGGKGWDGREQPDIGPGESALPNACPAPLPRSLCTGKRGWLSWTGSRPPFR